MYISESPEVRRSGGELVYPRDNWAISERSEQKGAQLGCPRSPEESGVDI